MTAESSPKPFNQISADAVPAPDANGLAEHESPELLRWRADILMDEMMLGAVDVAAGAHTNGTTTAAPQAAQDDAAQGASTPEHRPPRAESPSATMQPQSAQDFASSAPSSLPADPPPTGVAAADEVQIPTEPPASPPADEDAEWWRHPFRAAPPVAPRSAASALPYSVAPGVGLSALPEPAPTPPPPPADALLRPPSAVRSTTEAAAPVQTEQVQAPGGSRMRTGNRTNLLPRLSAVDTEALWREIDEMRAEIGQVIPEQHEWSVRSRHLIDKGEAILRQSPNRTAEVEYYLNQVRGILKRVRQSYQWSLLYMKRLSIYLWAWIAFAAVTATGCFLYRAALTDFFSRMTGMAPESFLMQMLPFWLGTVAVGALGGAMGAALNMRRHQHLEHGFFDRKYSLRGLLLPLIAGIVALLLFVPFALIAYFLPLSPAVALVILSIAALLAFVFGLFQESLYGTG